MGNTFTSTPTTPKEPLGPPVCFGCRIEQFTEEEYDYTFTKTRWRCRRFDTESACKSWLFNPNAFWTNNVDFQPKFFPLSNWPTKLREGRSKFVKENVMRGLVSFDDDDKPDEVSYGVVYIPNYE